MKNPNPVALFASGIAGFCTALKIPFEWANIFISLSIAAFLMTSVDTATRLARFTWQELFDPSAGASGEAAKPRPAWSMIFSTMYVSYTPVGSPEILGVQGRYFTSLFIYIFACLFGCLYGKSPDKKLKSHTYNPVNGIVDDLIEMHHTIHEPEKKNTKEAMI